MGKNLTIYFDDEALGYIEKLEGKGTLINNLVKDYFANDIENLKRKSLKLNFELEEINNKIEKIRSLKQEKEIQSLEIRKITEQAKRKQIISSKITELLRLDKISSEEWETCFDEEGIIEDKALKLIKIY